MIGTQMPARVESAILEAFAGVGYSETLVERNIDHSFAGQNLDPVQLAAFWKKPPDQFTSAVAVKWMASSEPTMAEIKTLGTQLWAPFGLIAKQTHCELWNTLPPSRSSQPTKIEESISYPDLPNKLKLHEHLMGRQQVQHRKVQSRQLALYEGASSNDVFLEWAFQPTQKAVRKLLSGLIKGIDLDEQGWPSKVKRLRLLLRFLAVRIALDKGKLDSIDRTSPQAILEKALAYPTKLWADPETIDLHLAEQFVNSMHSVNLGIVDGGTLSQILQMNGLPQEMRAQWRFYPTPADLAWRMVQAIPFQVIDVDELLVWDGTCGTGTLLVAALERLRQLNGNDKISGQRISATILGNDQEPLLSDLTRINLEIAAGDIECQQWNISAQDVLADGVETFSRRPSVILGNLPAKATGRGPNYAINIISKYVSMLGSGGLISTVVPRTLLETKERRARDFRQQLLNDLDIYEIMDVPQRLVPHSSSELAVISGRKRYARETSRSPITWKTLDPDRRKASMIGVISSPNVWLRTGQVSIEPPLLVQLRDVLEGHSVLSDLIGGDKVIEGITPGRTGKSDVLDHNELEAVPYLTPRARMVPFALSWDDNPRWIRYTSPEIFRARRSQEALFKERKVVLNRRTLSGHSWISLAAIVEEGIYPSDQFIAIGPEPTFPCEFICGLLNSALINCWLKLTNPSQTVRIEACRSIPMPKDYSDESIQPVVKAVNRIATLRGQYITGDVEIPHYDEQELIRATLELDQAVYDLYNISDSIRNEVGYFYHWYEKPRPGFEVYPKGTLAFSLPSPSSIFSESQASRLRGLQELKGERDLSDLEERELDDLATEWEEAYIAYNRLALAQKDNFQANG